MKMTATQLRQIIKEEVARSMRRRNLREWGDDEPTEEAPMMSKPETVEQLISALEAMSEASRDGAATKLSTPFSVMIFDEVMLGPSSSPRAPSDIGSLVERLRRLDDPSLRAVYSGDKQLILSLKVDKASTERAQWRGDIGEDQTVYHVVISGEGPDEPAPDFDRD